MANATSSAELIDPGVRISRRSFDRLAQFITAELGIKMPEAKISMIQSRLTRRVRELELESIDAYCDLLFTAGGAEAERLHLINAITTNKTDFFRESHHFQYLTETALPQLERSGNWPSNDTVSVWSAACSSGEEPYTLAMILSEYGSAHPGFGFQILATDISTKVLGLAQEGIYTSQQIEPIPLQLRRKYLLRGKNQQHSLRIIPALRRTVRFHQLNFMDADYCVREMFEIIFCRNVLIYFDRATQESVINKLSHNLIPGGYLFIGHSESLSGLNVPFVTVSPACYRKTKPR